MMVGWSFILEFYDPICIYTYIYSTLCIGYFHSPFCFPRKRRDLRFLLIFLDLRFTTSDNTGTTMGFRLMMIHLIIPSKAFYPSGKHTDSYWTWWFVWIYPLKMVIFHSFLHVYQRVTPWKGPHVHPESCCVRKLGFGTAADHHVHHRWLGRRNAATATLISQKLWPRGMKIHGMY